MPPISIILAFILDVLLGDPRRMPHPVMAVGKLVGGLEKLFNKKSASRAALFSAGLAVAVFVTLSVYLAASFLIKYSYEYLGVYAGAAVSIYLAYTTLSIKSLADAAKDVALPLEKGDLPEARKNLSMIVGRDTANLDATEVARGAVETVAENTSDGIIAPLFYLTIGGAPLALAYKAINTMDSMIGYKNERYAYFGRAAARLDDIANFIPARLTALLMVAASFLARAEILSWKNSWSILIRDRRKHPSPNSGYPEAAAAGALNVRLGGESSYSGVKSAKPFIGEPSGPLTPRKIRDAVILMNITALLGLLFSVVLGVFLYYRWELSAAFNSVH
ncbi:MAG: adenosylcobinamide-phosphate synthase CbiB [Nitrospirota bacterium]